MTENERREECIEDLNQQIDWIEGIKAHQFPGWGHAVNAMRQAIALLKAQEPVSIEERLVLDKLHTIQDYARVNEIHWMADGAAFAENVMNMLRGEINQFRKAQEPVKPIMHYVPDGKRSSAAWQCGNCLIDIGYGANYCYNCGQAVKWE